MQLPSGDGAGMAAADDSELQIARTACEKIYQLFSEKRFEDVREYLHPDVVIVNTVHPFNPQPDSGVSTLQGIDEVLQQMAKAGTRQVVQHMSIEHMITGSDTKSSGVYIVMVIQASSQNPATSKRIKDDRVCNIHHFVDGKLARMEDFRDPRQIIAANQAG